MGRLAAQISRQLATINYLKITSNRAGAGFLLTEEIAEAEVLDAVGPRLVVDPGEGEAVVPALVVADGVVLVRVGAARGGGQRGHHGETRQDQAAVAAAGEHHFGSYLASVVGCPLGEETNRFCSSDE